MERMKYQNVNKIVIVAMLFAIVMSACVGVKHTTDNVKPKVPKYRMLETFNNDTVAYLMYNFENRKEKYIGKTIKSMLKDLEVEPMDFLPYEYRADIKKCFEGTMHIRWDKKITYIYIYWKEELSYDTLENINKRHNRRWSKELENYIGNQIVTKIGVADGNR